MLTKGEIFFKSSFHQFTQKICSFHDGNRIVFYIFPFLHGTYFVESKILPTVLYHPKQQNAVISMLEKTMLNCFNLDGQF